MTPADLRSLSQQQRRDLGDGLVTTGDFDLRHVTGKDYIGGDIVRTLIRERE